MVKSLIENFIFCGVEKVANVARNETLFQVPSVSLLKFSMPTFFEEKQGGRRIFLYTLLAIYPGGTNEQRV